MSYLDRFQSLKWDAIYDRIRMVTPSDVERALYRSQRSLDDFIALISPVAETYLEQMAQLSQRLTLQRFGKTIRMYIPMYVSNECQNICTYCGFSMDHEIPRRTLTDSELEIEFAIIKSMGFDHILIVSGEANKSVGTDYFEHVIQRASAHFSHISLEVQPLPQPDYERLIKAGLNTVLVYQETYRRETYKVHHPKGRKSNFDYRLDTPDRLGRAGIHKIGIGSLIGLEDWRTDAVFTADHLRYLRHTYWKSSYSLSFPRLRPHEGDYSVSDAITDRQLVQLICAYRLFDPDVELSLSTRESALFRDHVIPLGITTVSAGSKTDPGGYAATQNELKQFEISDERSPAEVAEMIRRRGYDVVWKDWDPSLQLKRSPVHAER